MWLFSLAIVQYASKRNQTPRHAGLASVVGESGDGSNRISYNILLKVGCDECHKELGRYSRRQFIRSTRQLLPSP